MPDAQPDTKPPRSPASRSCAAPAGLAFERKVRLSRYAMFFEMLWPRLWLVIGVVVLFVVASLAGVWGTLGALTHKLALAAFAAAFLAARRARRPRAVADARGGDPPYGDGLAACRTGRRRPTRTR